MLVTTPLPLLSLATLLAAGSGLHAQVEHVETKTKPGRHRFAKDGRYGARKTPGITPQEVSADGGVFLALQWLAMHQDADGRWDTDGFMKHDEGDEPSDGPGNPSHDVGTTGLALLAFLGNGNTMRTGRHKGLVKRAVGWLQDQQGKNGLFGTNASHDFIYDHAIATCAMCEAYGLSDDKAIKKNAQAGIDYLGRHRNPYSVWRYQPRDNDNDLSVTSWCLLAYQIAKDFKLDVDERGMRFGTTFLDELTDPENGRCGYTKRGEPSARHPGDHGSRFPVDRTEALTAAALFVRAMLGQDQKKVPVMQLAAKAVLSKPVVWDRKGSVDFYYWYYASHAMYQMGDAHWALWNKTQLPTLLEHQRRDGDFKGSWNPVSVWSDAGGRVYATAMCTLALQAPIRYARKSRR